MNSHWPNQRGLAEAYQLYQRKLRESHALDFDDLIMTRVSLLQAKPAVAEKYRRRFRHVLVDEYQDTNHAQYRLLQLLCGEHGNVCAVGDPDQSIYAFRGAGIRNIMEFERDFPGARVLTLDRNYRSTRRILAVANAVIRHNRDRYEKELRTENAAGSAVREVRCESEEDEAVACARNVRAWTRAGAARATSRSSTGRTRSRGCLSARSGSSASPTGSSANICTRHPIIRWR